MHDLLREVRPQVLVHYRIGGAFGPDAAEARARFENIGLVAGLPEESSSSNTSTAASNHVRVSSAKFCVEICADFGSAEFGAEIGAEIGVKVGAGFGGDFRAEFDVDFGAE